MGLLNGILPKHQFALVGEVQGVEVVVHPENFKVPAFASDVFEGLLEKKLAGKTVNRGTNNIIHVDSLTIDVHGELLVAARRCDYAAYLGLGLSASDVLPDGSTLIGRYGRPLHEHWKSSKMRHVTLAPLGCTLGLTGICVSSDGFLITKKKPNVHDSTATDHGKRLHLCASQIRYDYPDYCFHSSNGFPHAIEQMKELLRAKEATHEIWDHAKMKPIAVGIFLKDHHPELFFRVMVDLTHLEILKSLEGVNRQEGEFEAISLEDTMKLSRTLSGHDDFPFADHHAGGLIAWLISTPYWHEGYMEFLPEKMLPASFS